MDRPVIMIRLSGRGLGRGILRKKVLEMKKVVDAIGSESYSMTNKEQQ